MRALKDGVAPDGVDLTISPTWDSTTRHWRFLREGHFDVAETSCSSYIVARDKGMAITAIPVFLHRRFRHGFVFINTSKGIKSPKDLIGKKIGIKSFLVTAIHWMRGILEHEYGVPHKSIHWIAELDEDVEFTPPTDLKITRLANDKSVEDMLAEAKHAPSIPISSPSWRSTLRAMAGTTRKFVSGRRLRSSQSCTMGIRQATSPPPWIPINSLTPREVQGDRDETNGQPAIAACLVSEA